MKRKLSVLALMLCCLLVLSGCCSHEWYTATCETPKTCSKCGETEGEALGHSWVDATCAAPKTCSACNLTEGQALGHNWVDATTEAPKTCTTCAATEGERIITDPRFTTATTKDLHGKWVGVLIAPPEMLGVNGLDFSLEMQVNLELGNEGSMKMTYAVANMDEFIVSLTDYMTTSLYSQFAEFGYTQEQADTQIMNQYGMTVPEYAADSIAKNDIAGTFEAMMSAMEFSGVYYVEGSQFCSGLTWDTATGREDFTLDGDTFTLQTDLGDFGVASLVFTRVTE